MRRVGAELAAVFLLLLAIVWRVGAWIAPDAEGVVGTLLGVAAGAIVLLMLLVPRDVFEAALADAELASAREAQPVERLS